MKERCCDIQTNHILYCTVICCPVLHCAVLCYAVLCYAMLCYAALCYAVLRCAMLRCAMLYCAVLCCVVLCWAGLHCAMLRCAVLRCAMLYCAALCYAALCRAALCYAVLRCAVLCCAVLCCAALCCAVLCCAMLCCAALCYAMLYCAALCYAALRYAVLCCTVPCRVLIHNPKHKQQSTAATYLTTRQQGSLAHMPQQIATRQKQLALLLHPQPVPHRSLALPVTFTNDPRQRMNDVTEKERPRVVEPGRELVEHEPHEQSVHGQHAPLLVLQVRAGDVGGEGQQDLLDVALETHGRNVA